VSGRPPAPLAAASYTRKGTARSSDNEEITMNNATFLSVQLNAEDFAGTSGLVELLNRHLLFATDVAEAADALVQLASVAHLSGATRHSVELPVLAIERLRDALDTLSGYDEAWLQALEPADTLFRDIARGPRPLH